MIRLIRGPEPADLGRVREKRLEKLRELIRTERRDPTSKEIAGYGLPSVRKALFDGQGNKCCYCEGGVEERFDPVEHYRPKSLVARDGQTAERSGYWWLAFSWDNLLYSCDHCNGEKGTKFPLSASSTPLAPEEAPPGAEGALLLNPYEQDPACDPVELIEFRRTTSRGKDTWEPFPRHGDERARRTIEDVVKLNRDGLLKRYRDHVKDVVVPKANAVNEALRGEELKRNDVRPLWNAYAVAVGRLLSLHRPFSALSYDAIRCLVPDDKILPHLGRKWPRPPADPC